MGFKSTFTTEDWRALEWPGWFVQKYYRFIWFSPEWIGTIASRFEGKTYGEWKDLHTDIQQVLIEKGRELPERLVLIYLHECGGITRCQISKDSVCWSEPSEWKKVDEVTHDSCYGCSDCEE